MKGHALINDKDLWEIFRTRLVDSPSEELSSGTTLKPFIKNSSALIDGDEVEIPESPKVSSREITLKFMVHGTSRQDYLKNERALRKELEKGSVTLFYRFLNTEFNLIYIGSGGKFGNFGHRRGKFTFRFLEPNPANRREL